MLAAWIFIRAYWKGLVVFAGLTLAILWTTSYIRSASKRQANAIISEWELKLAEKDRQATVDREKLEAAHQDAIAALDHDYQEKQDHAQANFDGVLADLRRGDLKLRTRLVDAERSAAAAQAAATPGERDGSQAANLSPENAEFLLRVGQEADAVVLQLGACQAVVTEDRKGVP